MKIPSKVKIGAITYEVKVLEDWIGRNEYDGECRYNAKEGNVIYIGAELSSQAQEITFLHEILHALNSTMDHEFVDSLAEQIYQVLYDNNMLR